MLRRLVCGVLGHLPETPKQPDRGPTLHVTHCARCGARTGVVWVDPAEPRMRLAVLAGL